MRLLAQRRVGQSVHCVQVSLQLQARRRRQRRDGRARECIWILEVVVSEQRVVSCAIDLKRRQRRQTEARDGSIGKRVCFHVVAPYHDYQVLHPRQRSQLRWKLTSSCWLVLDPHNATL